MNVYSSLDCSIICILEGMKRTVVFLFIATILYSCNKHVTELPACGVRLYGYKTQKGFLPDSNAQLGEISLRTNTNNSIALFPGSGNVSQGVYANDMSYYVPAPVSVSTDTLVLFRIHLGGEVKRLVLREHLKDFYGLVYSRRRDKLYCFKHYFGPGNITIAGINLAEGTFSTNNLNSVFGTLGASATLSSTIDDDNGIIYFSVNKHPGYSLYRFAIKDSSITTLSSGQSASILGVQFSPSDNTIYALRNSKQPFKTELLKITTQGTVTAIDSLPFNVDTAAYSTCFDACSNYYIISSMLDSRYSTLSIVDLQGKIHKHDSIVGMYQGLYIP